MGHGSAQLVAGKAAIGALEALGEVAAVARDAEGARMGCLVHSHAQFLSGFEQDAIPSPAKPVGQKKAQRRPEAEQLGQGLGQGDDPGWRGMPRRGKAPGTTRSGGQVSGQPQGLEGDGHSLHFGFATGLTLEADVICGEDDHTPGRLLRDDGGFHHWEGGQMW